MDFHFHFNTINPSQVMPIYPFSIPVIKHNFSSAHFTLSLSLSLHHHPEGSAKAEGKLYISLIMILYETHKSIKNPLETTQEWINASKN